MKNTNGLIRDYFPKGTDFNLVSKKQLKESKSAQ
jgi:IS30 family transposase